MKDLFLKKNIETEGNDTDTGIMINQDEEETDPCGELFPHQLNEMIDMSRKFFRISAELSINSN